MDESIISKLFSDDEKRVFTPDELKICQTHIYVLREFFGSKGDEDSENNADIILSDCIDYLTEKRVDNIKVAYMLSILKNKEACDEDNPLVALLLVYGGMLLCSESMELFATTVDRYKKQ